MIENDRHELVRFFEAQSCGQWALRRAGCETSSLSLPTDDGAQKSLEELCGVMPTALICGWGQAAARRVGQKCLVKI